MKVMRFPSKCRYTGCIYQLFFGGMLMNAKANLKTVGSEGYVQFCCNKWGMCLYMWKFHGRCKLCWRPLKNKTRLPSVLGHTLQHLSAHRTMCESSQGGGIGGAWPCGGWCDPGRDAFTSESTRVRFLLKQSWRGGGGGVGNREQRAMGHSVQGTNVSLVRQVKIGSMVSITSFVMVGRGIEVGVVLGRGCMKL